MIIVILLINNQMRLKNILTIVLILVYCAEFVSAKRSMEDLLAEIEMVIE